MYLKRKLELLTAYHDFKKQKNVTFTTFSICINFWTTELWDWNHWSMFTFIVCRFISSLYFKTNVEYTWVAKQYNIKIIMYPSVKRFLYNLIQILISDFWSWSWISRLFSKSVTLTPWILVPWNIFAFELNT